VSDQVHETPAGGNPLARVIGVLFSPAKAYEDISRSPSWLPPLLIYIVVFLGAFALYGSKADWLGITEDTIRDFPFLQLAGDDAADQAVEQQLALIRPYSWWQNTMLNGLNVIAGTVVFYHVMTLFYSTLFYVMGLFPDMRIGRAWLNFLFGIIVLIVNTVVVAVGSRAFQSEAPATFIYLSVTSTLILTGIYAWIVNRNASRDPALHRALCASTYASAVGLVGALALAATALAVPAPIQMQVQNVVKSNLGALFPSDNSAIQSLLSSMDIFSFWFLYILTVGYRTMAKTTTGMAASIVMLPWVVWVLLKLAWNVAFP